MYDHGVYMLYNAQLQLGIQTNDPMKVKVLVNSKHVHSLIPPGKEFVKLLWAFP